MGKKCINYIAPFILALLVIGTMAGTASAAADITANGNIINFSVPNQIAIDFTEGGVTGTQVLNASFTAFGTLNLSSGGVRNLTSNDSGTLTVNNPPFNVTEFIYTYDGAPVATNETATINVTAPTQIFDDAGNTFDSTTNPIVLGDLQAPLVVSAVTTSTTTINVTFSETISAVDPAALPGDFTLIGVANNSIVIGLSSSGLDSNLTLTLDKPMSGSDSPLLNYTFNSSDPTDVSIFDNAIPPNFLNNFALVQVTNTLAPGIIPPTITSWGNNKTNNASFNVNLNLSEGVNFNATPDQVIVTWHWFQDGVDKSNNLNNLNTSFSSGGLHRVEVNATNANGTSSTITWAVTVSSVGGVPSIISWGNNKTNDNSTSVTLNVNEPVTFNATANQTIDTWHWFQDDALQSNTSDNLNTSFISAGPHTVKVNATNNSNGTSSTLTWSVTVLPAGVAPNITSWNNSKTGDNNTNVTLNATESVNFNATADQVIDTWHWFQDDSPLSNTSDNLNTSFSRSGLHTVKVNASNNSNGTSNTITWNVTITTTNVTISSAKITGPKQITIEFVPGVGGTFVSGGQNTSYGALNLASGGARTLISGSILGVPGTGNYTFSGDPVATNATATINVTDITQIFDDATPANIFESALNPIVLTDGQPPINVSAATVNATAINITFSENINDAGATSGDFVISGVATIPNVIGLSSSGSDRNTTLVLDNTMTGSDRPVVNYTFSAVHVVDTAGNPLSDFVLQAVTDTLPPIPLVVTIVSPSDINSTNDTGYVNVTAMLNKTGTAQLNWNGVNITMLPGPLQSAGTVFSMNMTPLLSGNYTFKVYANDTDGLSNVSETRIVTVNRTTINNTIGTIIDPLTFKTNETLNITAPDGNVTVTIPDGTNASIDGVALSFISVDSLAQVNSTFTLGSSNDRWVGENISMGPEGAIFTPDIQIRFNYTTDMLNASGISASELRVKFYNIATREWDVLPSTLFDGYILVNVSHFSTFALIGTTSSGGGGNNPSSGGGSSGGGGGVVSGEDFANIAKSESNDEDLIANTPVTYTFKTPELGVYEIALTGKENELAITVRAEVLKGTSKQVTAQPSGTVYKNVNIIAGTSRMKEALVKFRVENTWLGSNSVAAGDVKLLHWDGSKWNQLDTAQTTTDATYTYYEAKTTSLSPFAISGITGGAAGTTATSVVTGTPGTTGTGTPVPTAANKTPGFEIGLTVAILSVAYLLGRKRR
ncbi:MAG: PGF-pre-PGF domain-containing protein [Candidatus Methanoperedens sp.]|nr:PGF-pre-PGF domain-containing protein [Candidatus Methanoperedens sp.]